MKVAVAGDSAGVGLARQLAEYLSAHDSFTGFSISDISVAEDGTEELYANLANRVAGGVLDGRFDRAILVCGTGIGVCISANKVPGIRAAQCHDTYSAERAVLSNNAQILTMGARVIGAELAKAIATTFLSHKFDEMGRSARNVSAINNIDKGYRAKL